MGCGVVVVATVGVCDDGTDDVGTTEDDGWTTAAAGRGRGRGAMSHGSTYIGTHTSVVTLQEHHPIYYPILSICSSVCPFLSHKAQNIPMGSGVVWCVSTGGVVISTEQ